MDYLDEAKKFVQIGQNAEIVGAIAAQIAAQLAESCALIAIAERLDKVITDRNGIKAVNVRQEK